MVPAAQFRNWQWLSLTLASPVAVWGAWPFHRAAAANAWHRAATMDTLISAGVSAAYLWSLYALFFGNAGQPGLHTSFALLAHGAAADAIYLDVAAGVTVLILTGRYFEARAKRRRPPRCGRWRRWARKMSRRCATAARFGSRWSSSGR